MKRSFLYILLLFPLAINAQLAGEVSVEGEYEPIIIETERLNEYPMAYRFDLPPIQLKYDTEAIASEFAPSILTMGVTGWNVQAPGNSRRGYLDLRLGSYLNSRLDAGYWIIRDSVNTLSADLHYRSTSLYKTHGLPVNYTDPQRRRLFDGTIGLNYSRLFGSEGLLRSRVDYRAAYFNYYGSTMQYEGVQPQLKVPSQTVNQFSIGADYASSQSLLYGWHLGGKLGFTGYRAFYYPDFADYQKTKGDRETRLAIDGGYIFSLSKVSAIALDGALDLLFYNSHELEIPAWYYDNGRKDYGIFTLTPAYRLSKGGFDMQAGVDLDFAFGAMGSDRNKNYSFLHVAPDVRMDYRTPQVGFYFSATGGSTPVTLEGMEKYNLYQMPVLLSTQPVYSPIDAKVGLNFGPYSGFTADIHARYAVARHTPAWGWYQAMLGTYLPEQPVWSAAPYYDYSVQGVDLHGFGIGLDLRYVNKGLAEASLSTAFTPQKGKWGIFNGYDRPRWTLDAMVAVNPISKLRVEAGYSFRGFRNIYTYVGGRGETPVLESMHLKNISNLKAKVAYTLFDRFDIYLLGENLLNRKIDMLPGLQCNGIALSGGIYWEF